MNTVNQSLQVDVSQVCLTLRVFGGETIEHEARILNSPVYNTIAATDAAIAPILIHTTPRNVKVTACFGTVGNPGIEGQYWKQKNSWARPTSLLLVANSGSARSCGAFEGGSPAPPGAQRNTASTATQAVSRRASYTEGEGGSSFFSSGCSDPGKPTKP